MQTTGAASFREHQPDLEAIAEDSHRRATAVFGTAGHGRSSIGPTVVVGDRGRGGDDKAGQALEGERVESQEGGVAKLHLGGTVCARSNRHQRFRREIDRRVEKVFRVGVGIIRDGQL